MKDKKKLSKEPNLLQLNPTPEEGILLVRERLQQAKLPFYDKLPSLIPAKHKYTELIIKYPLKRFCMQEYLTLLYKVAKNSGL